MKRSGIILPIIFTIGNIMVLSVYMDDIRCFEQFPSGAPLETPPSVYIEREKCFDEVLSEANSKLFIYYPVIFIVSIIIIEAQYLLRIIKESRKEVHY